MLYNNMENIYSLAISLNMFVQVLVNTYVIKPDRFELKGG